MDHRKISIDEHDLPTFTHTLEKFSYLGKKVPGFVDEIESHYPIYEKWGNDEFDVFTQPFMSSIGVGMFVRLHKDNQDNLEFTVKVIGTEAIQAIIDCHNAIFIFGKDKQLKTAFGVPSVKELQNMNNIYAVTETVRELAFGKKMR